MVIAIFVGRALLALLGLCPFISIPLILDRFQQNLVELSGPIKKMTHNDNGPGPGRNYRETAVFTFSRKVGFWLKIHFIQKTPKIS